MALSAASHVGAQVAFAVTFALILRRRGLLAGITAGAAAFGTLSLLIGTIPAWIAAAAAIPALLVGPRFLPAGLAGPGKRRSHRNTALASAAFAAA